MKLHVAIFTIFRPERAPKKNTLHCTERQRWCKKLPQPLNTGPHIRAFRSRYRHWLAHDDQRSVEHSWLSMIYVLLALVHTALCFTSLPFLTAHSSISRLPPRLFHDKSWNVSCLPATTQYSFFLLLLDYEITIIQYQTGGNFAGREISVIKTNDLQTATSNHVINVCKSYGTNTNTINVRVFL
jgi:hypothetical protein